MSEIKMNTVENLPILEEVPENATLLAEIDGEFYRVKNKKKLDVIITAVMQAEGSTILTSDVTYVVLLDALKSDSIGDMRMDFDLDDGTMYCERLTMIENGLYDEDGSQKNVIWVRGSNSGAVFFEDGRIIAE